ncbi:hypothetical protein SLA2020_365170 [Shorea laevis]
MAFAALGLVLRTHLTLPRPLVFCARKVRHIGSVAAVELVAEPVANMEEIFFILVLHFCCICIIEHVRIKSTPLSLLLLPFQVLTVELCTRSYPEENSKRLDIITSAELKEVRKTFVQCEIVGRRFPICHVHVDDTIVEVSSFSTSVSNSSWKFTKYFSKPSGCNGRDYIRWRNCLQRDFTINGLMFDPYAKIVYDYTGGMEDIRKAKVRTVLPANLSFVEDCARILRAFRIAARLGFRFTREIGLSVRELSCSVLRLDKGRILMEMNYMLAFGSAEASLRLLWRFGLLEILLPIQASYFASQGFRRRDERSNMLLSLFSNLDKLVAPNRPCHCSLWIAILAFHEALVDQPRDPFGVAAFSLAVHSGGSLFEAVEMAKKISQPHGPSFDELLEPEDLNLILHWWIRLLILHHQSKLYYAR